MCVSLLFLSIFFLYYIFLFYIVLLCTLVLLALSYQSLKSLFVSTNCHNCTTLFSCYTWPPSCHVTQQHINIYIELINFRAKEAHNVRTATLHQWLRIFKFIFRARENCPTFSNDHSSSKSLGCLSHLKTQLFVNIIHQVSSKKKKNNGNNFTTEKHRIKIELFFFFYSIFFSSWFSFFFFF